MLSQLNLLQVRRIVITGSLLAFVAGLINSFAFVAFGSFVSHVSGHATRMAMEFSEGHVTIALTFFWATTCFISGAMTTTLLLHGRFLNSDRVHAVFPILIETFLIVLVPITSQFQPSSMLHLHPWDTAALYLLSFAMGMQNALFRISSGMIIRTTHMTGVATDIGMTMGHVIDAFRRHGRKFSSKITDNVIEHNLHGLIKNLLLYLALMVSFLLGAMAGTFGFFTMGSQILYLVTVILLLTAIYSYQTATLHRPSSYRDAKS